MAGFPAKKFITVSILLTLTLATAPLAFTSEVLSTNTGDSLTLSNLAVPEELGKVQERFASNPAGSNLRTIIQIQDVHAHATAQQNIAALLERLRAVFGIEKVALEGAWATTSLPQSHAIPTSREKQLLARTLLEDDQISGPVYAAIMSPDPITLIGIEDEAAYEKNRALFLVHLGKAKEIEEKLKLYETSLKETQRSTWGPDLLAFGSAFGIFRDTSDLGKFFPILWTAAETQSIDTSDLSQILLLQNILSLEKLFQKERLEQEVKQVMRDYKNTPWTLEELIRGGKIPTEKLGSYPEIKKLTQLYKMRDQISLSDLTTQIETLTGRILEKLVRTPAEIALWEKVERLFLARRILLLQASPEDMKAFENEKTSLAPELAITGLSEALAVSLDFYAGVKSRDEIFFNKVMNDPALSGNIAIVTGGFHTDGLSQRFRDAGISYITITPELGGTAMNQKLYNARMMDGGWRMAANEKPETPSSILPPSSESSTLSELRNAIAWIDDRFPESYEVLLQTKDVRKAAAVFTGSPVALSRSAKASHLSRKGRIDLETKKGTAVKASELQVSEFMVKPRPEQLSAVQAWLTQGSKGREKAMLVSSAGILARMLSEEKTARLLQEAVGEGAIVALAQDIPAVDMPKFLSSLRGINWFEATDIATLVEKTPRFQRLAKKHPFAIMENGRPMGAYVVLPEKPISLVLFRIITLNPNLYQAAKDPAFLALLEDLVSEILSKELSAKAA